MTDAAPAHSASTPAATDAAHGNSEVRYERSDIETRGVINFVLVLLLALLVLLGFLRSLFWMYEKKAQDSYQKELLPLAGERDRMPTTPRLEGIDPTESPDRAWTGAVGSERPFPWFGYNVRIVPQSGGNDQGTEAEERDRRAAAEMQQKLKSVNEKLADLAGKLPVREGAGAPPPDLLRHSAGKSNAGRSAAEKQP